MNIALDLFLIVSFVIATLLNMLSPLKFTFDLSMTFIISGIIAVIFYFLLYYKSLSRRATASASLLVPHRKV